jgi:hypothetical protein
MRLTHDHGRSPKANELRRSPSSSLPKSKARHTDGSSTVKFGGSVDAAPYQICEWDVLPFFFRRKLGLVIIRHKDSDQTVTRVLNSKDEPYYTNVYEAAITRAIINIGLGSGQRAVRNLNYYPFLPFSPGLGGRRFCLAQQAPYRDVDNVGPPVPEQSEDGPRRQKLEARNGV